MDILGYFRIRRRNQWHAKNTAFSFFVGMSCWSLFGPYRNVIKILPDIGYFFNLRKAGAARSFESPPIRGFDIIANETKAGIAIAISTMGGKQTVSVWNCYVSGYDEWSPQSNTSRNVLRLIRFHRNIIILYLFGMGKKEKKERLTDKQIFTKTDGRYTKRTRPGRKIFS